MFSITAGKTAGPNGLKFFERTHGNHGSDIALKKTFKFFFHFFWTGKRRALQLELVCQKKTLI